MIIGVAKWRTPALTTTPQAIIDSTKPPSPSRISGLRPRRSDWRAQNGEASAHSRADSEKMAATIGSGMPIWRPIAGRTDCMPLLPSAVVTETQNNRANDRRRTCSGVGAGRLRIWVRAAWRAFMRAAT